MRRWLIAVAAAATAPAARAQTPDQSRIATLEAELADVKSELQSLRASVRELAAPASGGAYRRLGVGPDGSISEPTRRRLAGETYSAVPAWQLHEFPSGHSCNSVGSYTSLLPVAGSSSPAPTFNKATASSEATGELSLSQVAKDWTTTEIQRMAAPIKVVHSSDCSSAPTLELPLATTVSSLTVNGIDVGASLQSLSTASVCINMQTLNIGHSQGYVNIWVVDAWGHRPLTWPSSGSTNAGSFSASSTVVDNCFPGFKALQVQSSATDAWRGTITSSVDGGLTYQNMACLAKAGATQYGREDQGCTGTTNSTADIVVDADSSSTNGGCTCLNANFCTIVVA